MDKWYKQIQNNARVVIEFPYIKYLWTPHRFGTEEYWKDYEQALDREIREFEEFIKDHRSKDQCWMNVERVYQTVCKFCGHSYGVVNDVDFVPDCCDDAMEMVGINIEFLPRR